MSHLLIVLNYRISSHSFLSSACSSPSFICSFFFVRLALTWYKVWQWCVNISSFEKEFRRGGGRSSATRRLPCPPMWDPPHWEWISFQIKAEKEEPPEKKEENAAGKRNHSFQLDDNTGNNSPGISGHIHSCFCEKDLK